MPIDFYSDEDMSTLQRELRELEQRVAVLEAAMTLDTLREMPEGRYRMRVAPDDASLQFPSGFSFRCAGKLFVVFPDDDANQKAMGVVVPPSPASGDA